MTQKERLYYYLMINDTINPLESWTNLGIYRLSARIHDLIKDGHVITSRPIQVTNRFGEKITVSQYKLQKETEDEGLFTPVRIDIDQP